MYYHRQWFIMDCILWNIQEFMKLIILQAFLEGVVFLKRRKMPNPAHADDKIKKGKLLVYWSISISILNV